MSLYNYQVLSYSEFEDLAKDVVEQLYSIRLENFTSGKDGGIDLRYAGDHDEAKIIVQAKCYQNYTTLRSNLKKESSKVDRLAPERYILVTSVGLTPQNKDEIKEMFAPYIRTTADIIGGTELDFCIKGNQNILKRNYKLWLTGVEILDIVLHSKVVNRSVFAIEDIQEEIKYYVFNDSFTRAWQLLQQHKYTVISGIPGIGKKMLARMLVCRLMAEGYKDFVYIHDSIQEGYEMFGDEEKKQVFLFENFLGGDIQDVKRRGGISEILKFVFHIQRCENKMLILTAREYLLRQIENEDEQWKYSNIGEAKCVVDLGDYTKKIRAQILCNHLVAGGIPKPYLETLSKNYLPILMHRNFNPQIIRWLVVKKMWKDCPADEFPDYIREFFDDPDKIWDYAFNELDRFSQVILVVLYSLSTPVLYEDLWTAVKAYLRTTGEKEWMSIYRFEKAVRVLEGSFIVLLPCRIGKVVMYKNLGINDFLHSRLEKEDYILTHLVKSVVFINQITHLFCRNIGWGIELNEEQRKVLAAWYVENQGKLKSSVLHFILDSEGIDFVKREDEEIYFTMFHLLESFGGTDNRVEDTVAEYINTHRIRMEDTSEIKSCIRILERIDLSKLKKPATVILEEIWDNLHSFDDYWLFGWLSAVFPAEFEQLTHSAEFCRMLDEVIRKEIDRQNCFEGVLNLELTLEQLNQYYPFVQISDYDHKLCRQEEVLEDSFLSADSGGKTKDREINGEQEDKEVDEVFACLLCNKE